MRWLVVRGAPPLPVRPSRVAQAQPPGPGLPEQAPSVHTCRAPSAVAISRRAPFALLAAGSTPGFAAVPFAPHRPCAQPPAVLTISSPGWTGAEQTRHVVA